MATPHALRSPLAQALPTQPPPRVLLAWPAPALLAWLAAWATQRGLLALGLAPAWCWAVAAALVVALACALPQANAWRRLIVVLGFGVSGLVNGQAALLPAWAWLLPMAALLAAYPLRAWRDAPLFPTPPGALAGLAALAPLPAGASVLDAGCGLGHGLAALRSEYAGAHVPAHLHHHLHLHLHGIEWSGLLRLATAARCPWATVRRADMWAADWSAHALVYLFQRPESMARAWFKAQAEMAPGSWLVSLEFAVPGVAHSAVLQLDTAKPVWLYRVGGTGPDQATQPDSPAADNPVNKPAHPGQR